MAGKGGGFVEVVPSSSQNCLNWYRPRFAFSSFVAKCLNKYNWTQCLFNPRQQSPKVLTLIDEEPKLLGFASTTVANLCLIPEGLQHVAGWSEMKRASGEAPSETPGKQ